MPTIREPINVRELNQRTSAVLSTVHEHTDIVPVRRGREGEVIAYLVPARIMFDHEAIDRARAVGEASSTVEDLLAMRRSRGGRLAELLDEMRGEEQG